MSKDGINGIPVKIKTSKSTMETIFFATFRKCPALKELAKKFNKLSVKIEKVLRREQFYSKKMYSIKDDLQSEEFEKELETYSNKVEELREEQDVLTEEAVTFQHDYCVKSLIGAGYTKTQAEEFADYIPTNRFPEVLEATRTGAMTVIDFFTEKSLPEENLPTT